MISHYLMFNRDCAAALDLYARAFGVAIGTRMTYAEMPPDPTYPLAESDKGLIMHADFKVEGSLIMCADSTEEVISGDNTYLAITTKDEALIRKAFASLSECGEVYDELHPEFFSPLYGTLKDRHGISWMFVMDDE